MTYHLTKASLQAAIRHLCRYGDTDIFPRLPELAFFAEEESPILSELLKLDLDSYTPDGAVEALAPKGRYTFLIAHQLSALDTLLLVACIVEIGENVETKRQPVGGFRAFSYQFAVDDKTGQIFRDDRTYKDWLHKQLHILTHDDKITRVVSTDISDYYSRISFRRLENLLDDVAPDHGSVRFIKKHIRIIRAKQSFGIPVGGSAARLLAIKPSEIRACLPHASLMIFSSFALPMLVWGATYLPLDEFKTWINTLKAKLEVRSVGSTYNGYRRTSLI